MIFTYVCKIIIDYISTKTSSDSHKGGIDDNGRQNISPRLSVTTATSMHQASLLQNLRVFEI